MEDLPTEILLNIFNQLNIDALIKMRLICRRFKQIVDGRLISPYGPLGKILMTNRYVCNIHYRNSAWKPNPLYLLRVHKNWKAGRYREFELCVGQKRVMPSVQLTDEHLWYARMRELQGFDRDLLQPKFLKSSMVPSIQKRIGKCDISCFKVLGDLCIIGSVDGNGSIVIVDPDDRYGIPRKWMRFHGDDVYTLDFNRNVLVTGSKDQWFKVWKLDVESPCTITEIYGNMYPWDRVLKVELGLGDDCTDLAIGTTSYHNYRIDVYDMSRRICKVELGVDVNLTGISVRDIRWASPHTLFTAGYDPFIKYWDLRTPQKPVATWEDPFMCSFYCLQWDGFNGLVGGSAMNGRISLWDMRQRNFMQIYFIRSSRNSSSPVYQMAFNESSLFAATDQTLSVLNFDLPLHETAVDYTYVNKFRTISRSIR